MYDPRNRLIDSRAPHLIAESITQYLLDVNSNPIDPNGNPSSTTYDAFNRVASSTHREGGTTQFEQVKAREPL
ncbi:MAG: hypothetical protein GKR94_29055 [Gammaproteobacteria bacterium]|nr:hypothetical protein [Gammaproteobacteria bacterium]